MRLTVVAAVMVAGFGLLGPAVAQSPVPPRAIMPRQGESMPGPAMALAPGADLPGADPLQVLANSTLVQRDLGLNSRQLDNLQLASRNFLTQMGDLMRPGIPPEQARAAMADQMAKTQPMIARELTTEQLARLQQIMLQIQGPCTVVNDPRAADQLGLTGAAAAQAQAVCQQRGAEMRSMFQPPAPGTDPCLAAAANRTRLTQVRADGDARVLALFSPDQRAAYMRMEGRPLHLEAPMPPGCARPG